jgi:hypothetical protein
MTWMKLIFHSVLSPEIEGGERPSWRKNNGSSSDRRLGFRGLLVFASKLKIYLVPNNTTKT